MNLFSLVTCEIRKIVKSSVFWVVVIGFTLLPLLALFKYLGAANVSWGSYLAEILKMFVSLLIIGFAFTNCWVFGREYTDKTIHDLLVKPVSKLSIAISKFIALLLWNNLLTVLMFAVILLVGASVGLTGGTASLILHDFLMFLAASLLVMAVSTLSSFTANVMKGYLGPIGIIFLIVVVLNIVNGYDWLLAYIPWTIPRLLISDGALRPVSVIILAVTGTAGFAGTVAWWRYAEQQ